MNNVLPGKDLIEEGLRDLRQGRETAALLVAIGSPRLRRAGIEIPLNLPDNPEHRLYDLLAEDDSDSVHSRYNAFIRRLVSTNEQPSSNKKFRIPKLAQLCEAE